jgi:hypothetical protein
LITTIFVGTVAVEEVNYSLFKGVADYQMIRAGM